ncbi:hypothetical protein BH23BAC3_BH23BAC3_32190 [soil metagenome]
MYSKNNSLFLIHPLNITQFNSHTRLCLMWCTLTFLLLSGCKGTPRLDANFDSENLGTPPSNPLPTPPNDDLNWRPQFATSEVVTDPNGGRWVRVRPLPVFTASPDARRVVLIALTDHFTANNTGDIHGKIRLRLDGLGTIGVGFRPLQGRQTLDNYIGGVELSNFLAPSTGSIHMLRPFSGMRFSDIYGLPTSGQISNYTSGTVVDINWSIDQHNRILYAGVGSGTTQSTSFPAMNGSVANIPIQRLGIWIWMQRPTNSTVLYIDNLLANE